jgi:hypothetical protein
MSHENGGEPWFEIKEVYYDDDHKVTGYCDRMDASETPEDVIANLKRMLDDIEDELVVHGVTLKEITNGN